MSKGLVSEKGEIKYNNTSKKFKNLYFRCYKETIKERNTNWSQIPIIKTDINNWRIKFWKNKFLS